jgi:hypothetical protein
MTIRLEDGHITVAGDANYEAELERLVRGALATVTGQAIATKIRAHGNVLLAQDYPGMDRRELNDETTDGRTKGLVSVAGVDIVFSEKQIRAISFPPSDQAAGHG